MEIQQNIFMVALGEVEGELQIIVPIDLLHGASLQHTSTLLDGSPGDDDAHLKHSVCEISFVGRG